MPTALSALHAPGWCCAAAGIDLEPGEPGHWLSRSNGFLVLSLELTYFAMTGWKMLYAEKGVGEFLLTGPSLMLTLVKDMEVG